MSAPDVLQAVCGDQLRTFRTLSTHTGPVSPLIVESGLIDPRTGRKMAGVPLGYAGPRRSAGGFSFDEYVAHNAIEQQMNSLNSLVFGMTGFRKSAGEKLRILRDTLLFGRNYLVTDRKGHEYTPLVKHIPGAKVLKFGPESNHFINPLDPVMTRDIQLELLVALALNAMQIGTKLSPTEHQLLWRALQDAHNEPGQAGVPTIDTLLHKLLHPSQATQARLGMDQAGVREGNKNLRMGLMRLAGDGDLAGMLHKPTTPGLFDAVPLLVLDCDGIDGEKAVIMVTLINFFTLSKNAISDSDNRFHHVLHDESWDLATYPGFVDSVRRGFKLGRTKGFGNRLVNHHWKNIIHSGNDKVEDLIGDSSLIISYRQDPPEIEASAHVLGYSDQEVERIKVLPPGSALYKIRGLPAIEVEYVALPWEIPMLNTSSLVHGRTDLPRAMPLAVDTQGGMYV